MDMEFFLNQLSNCEEDFRDILTGVDVQDLSVVFRSCRGINNKKIDQLLKTLADHEDYHFRTLAAREIKYRGNVELNPILLKLLFDPRKEVRENALISAGESGDPNWLPVYSRFCQAKSRDRLSNIAMANVLKAQSVLLSQSSEFDVDSMLVAMKYCFESDTEVSLRTVKILQQLRKSEKVGAYAKSAIEIMRRYDAPVYEAVIPNFTGQAQTKFMKTGMAAGGGGSQGWIRQGHIDNLSMAKKRELVNDRSPQYTNGIDRVIEVVKENVTEVKKKRFLYGGFTGYFDGEEFHAGNPGMTLGCIEGQNIYRYSVSISPEGEQIKGITPLTSKDKAFAATPEDITLQIAVLTDNNCLNVLDNEVKPLVLPKGDSGSRAIHFRLQAVFPSPCTEIEVLVYFQGCLILRGKSYPFSVQEIPVHLTNFSDGPTVSENNIFPTLSYSDDLETITRSIEKRRFFNLLIDDLLLGVRRFTLCYLKDGEYHLISKQISSNTATWDAPGIREKLIEWIGSNHDLLQKENIDFHDRKTKEIQKIINELRNISREIFAGLFCSEEMLPIKTELIDCFSNYELSDIFEVVSNDLFIPWQLFYIEDGGNEANLNNFVGMKYQVEQTLGKGTSLEWNLKPDADPPVGFFNNNLFIQTMDIHTPLFAKNDDTEGQYMAYTKTDDLKRELVATGLKRRGFYFFCHGQFDPKDDNNCWIMIEDGSPFRIWDLKNTNTSPGVIGCNTFKSAPWIFLNACECGQIGSSLFNSMAEAWIGIKKSGCLIAPETKMPVYFGANFGNAFLEQTKTGSQMIGQILLSLRRDFAKKYNNPLGLLYDLYSNAEYKVS